jgi:hypothetical protein
MWWESDEEIEKMAYEISKNYSQPHILIRWLMLYREIMKIPLFIEVIKGNLENKLEYIPFTIVLCDTILDEIKITPEYQKYLSQTEEIREILNTINYDKIDSKNNFEQRYSEGEHIRRFKNIQLKTFRLFLEEKHNFKENIFNILEKDNTQELIQIYNTLSSQTENDLL